MSVLLAALTPDITTNVILAIFGFLGALFMWRKDKRDREAREMERAKEGRQRDFNRNIQQTANEIKSNVKDATDKLQELAVSHGKLEARVDALDNKKTRKTG